MKPTFLIVLMLTFAISINAQVTIGSSLEPDKNALLDIKSAADNSSTKGILPPRVGLSATTLISPMTAPVPSGLTVYNTATTGDVTPGYYYWNGTRWVRLVDGETALSKIFYMPSIVLAIDNSDPTLYNSFDGTTFTVNLYNRYAVQYGMSAPNVKQSPTATSLPVYLANQLEYFITYYDTDVFATVNVNDAGVLTYTLKPAPLPISEKTFMNIVFKVKPQP
jgi:hypothetical protein